VIKDIYVEITGTTGVETVTVSTAHNAATAVATFKAKNTTLEIGDAVTIRLGYVGDHDVVFRGFVKTKDEENLTGTFTISAQDELVRAVDFYIASSTPDSAFSRQNISAEFLIRDLLQLAGITNYNYQPTSFVFATQGKLEINLVGCYDICKQISDILAWHIYADVNNQVHFVERRPHLMVGDTPDHYINDTNILSIVERVTTSDLRNRVVVYGRGSIAATAQATSPYLPAGFYKSTVLATDFIDSQSIAQQAANYNLNLLNRLGESLTITIEGNPIIMARDIINVTESILGISGDYYAYGVDHSVGKDGYKTELVLRK